MIEFCIEQFEAVISTNFKLEDKFKALEGFQTPLDLNFIPPLERRRLGRAGSSAFFLYEKFTFKEHPLLVFSSFAGEINNCFTMLNALIRNEPLSPNAFSVSVLNATPALLAIKQKNHSEITALSANPSFEYAIISAYTKLYEQKEREAFVMSYFENLSNEPQFLMLAIKMSLKKPNFRLEFHPNSQKKELVKANLSECEFLYHHLQKSFCYEVESENVHFKWSRL